MGIKIKKITFLKAQKMADKAFSLYVRARAKNKCELKHLNFKLPDIIIPFRCSGVLQCCHKYSRKYKSIRYDLRNVYCGCASGNTWANYNPIEWYVLWREMWKDDVEYLDRAKKMLCHRKTSDLLTIAKYYEQEYNKLKEIK